MGKVVKIELRKPLVSDAKRFYEILNHPEFHYFPVRPVSIKVEKEFLRGMKERAKKGFEHHFAIIANGKNIGAAGFSVIERFPNRCAVGYFIDRKYWGKGIATKVVGMLEDHIVEKTDVVRIEIAMAKDNIGSRRVAIKSGYKKEGLMRKYLKIGDKCHDSYMYAKIVK